MADLIPFTTGQMPPEMEAEALAINRRKQVAQALQDQSLQPLKTQMVGDRVVRNTAGEGMTQLGKALIAAMANRSVDSQQRQLASDYKSGVANAMSQFEQKSRGIPGQRDPQEYEQQQDQGTPLPYRQAPDRHGAIIEAMGSGYGRVADLAKLEWAAEKASEAEAEKFHHAPAGSSVFQGSRLIGQVPGERWQPHTDHSLPADWERHLPASAKRGTTPGTYIDPKDGDVMQLEFEDGKYKGVKNVNTMPKIDARTINPAAVTPVTIADPKNPNATIVVDGRTGKKIGDGPKLTQTGTVDQRLRLAMPQAKLHVGTLSQNLDRLDEALGTLHNDPGLPNITGTIMGRTPNVTNKATGAQGTLNEIKSNIFQTSLQAMREASKTGGAVGNVSDKEGDKLERTIAALDQAQGTTKFKEQLKAAQRQVMLSKTLIQNAYTEQYGHLEENESDVRSKADAILKGGK